VFDFTDLDHWDLDKLAELPPVENERLEYKSSRVSFNDLRIKISVAASAFWNTGGGVLVVGVDDNGKVDGGIPILVGNEKLEDWVDKAVGATKPAGPYKTKLLQGSDSSFGIEEGKSVLVIGFGESAYIPHMAKDHKYYIRAGAHSVPTGHYLVEALRARRAVQSPMLRGVIRKDPRRPGVKELAIVALNDAPALDVQVSFDPLPSIFPESMASSFPLIIPVVGRDNPFSMDISLSVWGGDPSEGKPVRLQLLYRDLLGKELRHEQLLKMDSCGGLISFGTDALVEIHKSIDKLTSEVRRLGK
jgi:hypothetical protein